jgi:hypothetical protein
MTVPLYFQRLSSDMLLYVNSVCEKHDVLQTLCLFTTWGKDSVISKCGTSGGLHCTTMLSTMVGLCEKTYFIKK